MANTRAYHTKSQTQSLRLALGYFFVAENMKFIETNHL